MKISDNGLPTWLDANTDEAYDDLDFGIVRMDYRGIITAYNSAESALSGVTKENAIGKHFFTQVAPCTNNFMVAERYKEEELDEVIPYMFTYVTKPTKVELRLIKAKNGNQYLLAHKA
ncbi:photoactive yellow protein [Pedobacter hiemivivus]|uniref:Photoactive yellow protein n=1 Tax=Pedobacter hiemivivus TaxID=2530454 RepID=A0A4V5PE52_9SPHI|nr:photoactive yellow protein [Pedobacter hiemivivus]TKC63566.1 photoactive yellow protein [Pedobacter hiemivivus]